DHDDVPSSWFGGASRDGQAGTGRTAGTTGPAPGTLTAETPHPITGPAGGLAAPSPPAARRRREAGGEPGGPAPARWDGTGPRPAWSVRRSGRSGRSARVLSAARPACGPTGRRRGRRSR